MELAKPPAAEIRNAGLPLDQHEDSVSRRKFRHWAAETNTLLTIASATVVPILYLLFIGHYAVNSFTADDWSVIPLIDAALHGHLSADLLWSQHHESRLVIGNLIDVLFGFTNRLDARAVIFFSAAVFVASYVGLLLLVRSYLSTRLTPIPVLVIGVVWFSVADVQNALWAFQVSWYLTVFFFMAMLCVMLLPQSRRPLCFGAAVLLAVAASLSTVQGFICWPLGAACILWPTWSRRARTEIAVWLSALVVTLAAYLPGYHFQEGDTCLLQAQCSINFEVHHPVTALAFFFTLIGNVIPGLASGASPVVTDPARFVVVGVVLFAVAVFILVQSWRYRSFRERLPLPAMLIAFGLLFDVTIAIGRSGTGVAGAVHANRFIMANLILLAGIVIYAVARVPTRSHRLAVTPLWRVYGTYLALFALALFVVVQSSEATRFGMTNGRSINMLWTIEARDYVNIYPSCNLFKYVPDLNVSEATLLDSAEDHLGPYGSTTYRHFRELGPTPDAVIIVSKAGLAGCFLPPIAGRPR